MAFVEKVDAFVGAYLAGLSGGASCSASGSRLYASLIAPEAHSAAISSVSAALSWGLGVRRTLPRETRSVSL